ncbi:MAG: FkbM family methyltransferase [Pseudomonadota bacterium]
MFERIRIKKHQVAKCFKRIQGSGAWLCMLDSMLNREVLRLVSIKGTQVYVRSNTPDLEVAFSSLYDEEYGSIRLSHPKIIIDAGANIGTSSIYFARKFPDAKIFAVEPEASNFQLLRKNLKQYPNVVVVQAAFWGTNGTRKIRNRLTGHWGYTVAETTNRTQETGQEINCVTIDSFMKEHGIESIDLLKMDIEGGEKEVLENSHGWIGSVTTMSVELHDRISMGCSRAFYLATKDFHVFEKHGEKVTAYRT